MKARWLGLILFIFCSLTVRAHADDKTLWQRSTLKQVIKNGELRVGLEPGYAPFEMVAKDGGVIGFDVDLAQTMADEMGVKLKIVKLDWNGMLPGLLTDQFDIIISGMTITPQRNLWINFADPYMTVGQTILVNRKLARKIKSHKDLNKAKYTVTTKTGTTAFEAIKGRIPKAKLRLMKSEWLGVKEVLEGRADAFVYDLPFNAVAAARYPKKLHHIATPFTKERLGFGVRKGDPDFLNWLNHFLAQINADGRFEAIRKKWFVEREWLQRVTFD